MAIPEEVTVTLAVAVVPGTPEAPGGAPLATMVAEPVPELGAVYCPVVLRVPTPVRDQTKLGWLDRGLPNWSIAVAVNCCVPPSASVALPGVTPLLVIVWFTVTVTLLVLVKRAGSVTVTWKV